MHDKHNARQYLLILRVARTLFTERGLTVSLGQIAEACGLSRGTLYKYFKNKEALLWSIQHYQLHLFGQALAQREADFGPGVTCLQRYRAFFDEMLNIYECAPEQLLFMGLFNSLYQQETTSQTQSTYRRYFHAQDFGTQDTVRFLEKNAPDESLRAGLNPHVTAVSATYCAYYTLFSLKRDESELQIKYSVHSLDLARFSFDHFLIGISRTGQLP